MQSSIYPEVVAGRIENRAITPDDLHPNDEGHALVASVITYFLEQVRSGKLTGSNASFAPGAKLPVPLTKNAYEDSVRIRNAAAPDMAGLQQPTLDGFTPDETAQNGITDCFRYGWTAEKTGDAHHLFGGGQLHCRPVPEIGKASGAGCTGGRGRR